MSKSATANSRFFPSMHAAIIAGAAVMPVFLAGLRFIETTLHSQLLLFLWSIATITAAAERYSAARRS